MSGFMYTGNENVKLTTDEAIERLEYINQCKFSEQQLEILRATNGIKIVACAGSGKALVNGSGVLTADGYVKIESLNIGDMVFGDDGKLHKVLGVYSQGKKRVYKVHFSDGSVVECCNEHLWTIKTDKQPDWHTVTLQQIIDNINLMDEKVYIPMTETLKLSRNHVLLSGYTYGVLLNTAMLVGDKCRLLGIYDDEIIDKMNYSLALWGASVSKEDYENFTYVINTEPGDFYIQDLFKSFGLDKDWNDRYILDDYKYSSDRLDLLSGLLDTSASCSGNVYRFESGSERLVADAKFIVESLGMTAIKRYSSAFHNYYLDINTSQKFSKLHTSKLLDKDFEDIAENYAKRRIMQIEKQDYEKEMTCIEIDSASRLYLTDNCIVTHNTTSIVNLVVKRLMTGEIKDAKKLLLTTYSKAGAVNMTERINTLLNKAGYKNIEVEVRTLHSLYYSVLRRFGMNNTILSGGQRTELIRQAIKSCKLSLRDEEVVSLDNLFAYQVNHMLTNEAIYKSYTFDLDISLSEYIEVLNKFASLKKEQNCMDFDDLQLNVYYQLCVVKNAEMIQYIHDNYEDIYVDEFQDTSSIQYKILQSMITDSKHVVFVGDDDQCIYSWRGAKADLLLYADVDYHIDKINLDTNYRCTDTILNFAKLGIEHMSRREAKDMRAYKEGGTVKFVYMDSKDLYSMSQYVADKIESMIKVDNIKAEDICVLVRNNAHAHVLNEMLMLKDIYCNFGDDMKLSYQVIYKDVDNIVELCGYDGMSSYDRNACSAVLWKMVKFLSSRNAGLMAEFMQNTGCNFTDTLNWILANAFSIGTYKGNAQVGSQLRSRIIQSFRRLGSDSVYCLEKIYELLTEADADNRLIGLLWLYKEGMSFMTKKTSKKRDFDCYFKFFETIAKEKGFNEFKNIMSKIKMYENANYAAMYGNAVKLSTIHGAKGLEWKHVILLAYDNISFPDVDYMVSKQDISSIDMQAYIDGERRLAYVGITRAVDSLTIITDKDNMSLFGLEALGGYNQNTFDGSYLDFAKYVKSHNYTTPENMRLSESYTEFKYKKEE